jgi:diacylglycerol kinase (ATP)
VWNYPGERATLPQSQAKNETMPKALLIYNPVAGRYPSRLLTERAAAVLQRMDWQVKIETTREGEDVTRFARQAGEAGLDALFVVGGDGSVNRALPGLIGSRTALGVLPAGTSNVWAQELGLPGLTWTRLMALEESAARQVEPQVVEVDVGLCNGIPFLLWAGVGLDGFIVNRIEPRKPWEKHFAILPYAAKAVFNAANYRGIDLKIVTGEEVVSGRFMLAVASNVRLYAGGLANLSPEAKLDDGLMDLWLFEGKSLEDIVQQAWNLWSGRHTLSERVRGIRFQKVYFESETPMYLQVDGEPENAGTSMTIEVLSRALHILVPRNAKSGLFQQSPKGL